MNHKICVYWGMKDPGGWNEKILRCEKYPRHWITTIDLEIQLSDNRWVFIPKGYIWDGASIPKFLWWLFKPVDEGKIGDLIHDDLWVNQIEEIEHHGSIFKARRFSEENRLKMRNLNAPKKKIKNYITHYFLRWAGGFFYSRQIEIPT